MFTKEVNDDYMPWMNLYRSTQKFDDCSHQSKLKKITKDMAVEFS